MWLVPAKENDLKQQIGFLDFHPEVKESLSQLVKRVNNEIQSTGIPGNDITVDGFVANGFPVLFLKKEHTFFSGQLLNTETVFSPHSARQTQTLIWRDSQCEWFNYSVLRIFFIIAQPRTESIGNKISEILMIVDLTCILAINLIVIFCIL